VSRRCVHLTRNELPAAVLVRVERHAEAPDTMTLDMSAEMELCAFCIGELHVALRLMNSVHAKGLAK
jgi:hypothetical protein